MGKLLDDAVHFAVDRHSGQLRKASGTPYILHPLEVAVIISGLTSDENVIAAGLLHDTVEDTDTSPEEIREKFGDRVAELVACDTEDKFAGLSPADTWLERKRSTLRILSETTDPAVRIMWLADKLSNIRSFYRSFLENGESVWDHFNQRDPEMHAWYYRTVAEYTSSLSDTAAYKEFTGLIEKMFGRYGQ